MTDLSPIDINRIERDIDLACPSSSVCIPTRQAREMLEMSKKYMALDERRVVALAEKLSGAWEVRR